MMEETKIVVLAGEDLYWAAFILGIGAAAGCGCGIYLVGASSRICSKIIGRISRT